MKLLRQLKVGLLSCVGSICFDVLPLELVSVLMKRFEQLKHTLIYTVIEHS